ncbi:TonB-dependent heme/hemoglobin receptor family protein [Bacteriovorax sp. BAL6_X]|uniref:TonB-dependent receptor domain-containing protein n=1 Tax=Bacteriovorax sp. BAL6_X TaxID=1201290 RepID=UPI000386DB6C|nr:TonB-dependent receptor [Bacteriovorax sp. BAL6_X]EPZ49893.1 TonB-dependent heme/hemoglobin receptor family protein [Bacteriovorax sp. BAL6_X]
MIKKFDGQYLLVFLGLLTNSLIFAQDVNRLESIYITDEVEAYEEGQSTTLGLQDEITSDELEEEVAQSIDDVLKNTSGATTKGGPRSIGETPQVRGLEANKLFVNIDGVKQTFYFSNHNYSHLAVDPDSIKKVDIFKSNTDYSQGISLGGGMSFVTKDGSDYLKAGEKSGSILKYSFEEASNMNAESVKTFGLMDGGDYLLSAGFKDSKDLKLSDDTTLKNSAFESYNFSTKFAFDLKSSQKVKLSAEIYNLEDESPLNATLDPPSDLTTLQGKTIIKRESVSAEYKRKGLVGNLYFSEQFNKQLRDSDGRKEERNIETIGTRIKDQLNLRDDLKLVIGADATIDKVTGKSSSGSVSDYPDGQITEAAAFAQMNYKAGGLSVAPGIRFSDYKLESKNSNFADVKDNNLSSKIFVNYEFKGFNFFSNFSQGFNSPDVQEVYATGLHRPGDGFFISDNYFVTNLDLKPETSNTLEFGTEFKKQLFSDLDLLTFRASGYISKARDYIDQEVIDYAIIDGKNGTTQFVNRDKVTLYGQEFDLKYLYDQFELTAGYSRSVGWDNSRKMWLSNMPANTYTLGFSYYLDQYGIKLGYGALMAMRQDRVNPASLERTTATPGYTLHNIFASKEFSYGILNGLKITTRLDNLTDKSYRRHGSYIHEVGRNFKMSLQYKIKHF